MLYEYQSELPDGRMLEADILVDAEFTRRRGGYTQLQDLDFSITKASIDGEPLAPIEFRALAKDLDQDVWDWTAEEIAE